MRKFIISIFLVLSISARAQQKLTFSYDNAGNQISRVLCINCQSKPANELKEIEALVEDDLLKFSSEDFISYYPNPVREELYLKWELANDNTVSSIQVYAMNGQLLKTFYKTENINAQNIAFQDYPVGVYLVALIYTTGEQKTIKIIKQ